MPLETSLLKHNCRLRLKHLLPLNAAKAPVVSCNDANTMYSLFLVTVRYFIDTCIPTKTVTLGPRDPDFVTPLVKCLLCKRRKLRRQGKDVEADALAAKINRLISDYRKTRLSHLSEAGPKELWEAVVLPLLNQLLMVGLTSQTLIWLINILLPLRLTTYIISKMCSSTMQYQYTKIFTHFLNMKLLSY